MGAHRRLGPGFLATAILLANNVRDVNEDRVADKRTLVVRFGRPFASTRQKLAPNRSALASK